MPRLTRLCIALGLCFNSAISFAGAVCDQAGSQAHVLDIAPAVGASTEAVAYRFENGEWLIPLSALGYHAAAVVVTCDIAGSPHALLNAGDVASYDEKRQTLSISEDLRRSSAQTLSFGHSEHAYSPIESGLRSVIDFALIKSDHRMGAGGFVEHSFRTEDWLFHSSATAGNLENSKPSVHFLDNYARTENHRKRSFIQVGDTSYLSDLNSRAVRMTGVSFGLGIAVNPWYLPYSYGTVNATSVVPSTMEVFVDQQRLQRQRVDAGPFSLTEMAGPIGYGEYRVVTQDALGRAQVTTHPFYNSPDIIAKGFLEYRVDIGRARERYGNANYDFGRLASIAYLRYGVTRNFTMGAQAMHASDSASIGVKPAYRIGTFGVIDGTAQVDKAGNRSWSAAAEHATKRYSMRAEYGRTDSGYRDVLADSRNPMPLQRLVLHGFYRFTHGSISLSHLAMTTPVQGRTVVNSLGAQYAVNRNMTLIATASANRNRNQSDRSLFIGTVINFGKRMTSLTSGTYTADEASYQTSLSRSPGASNGFGYEVMAANRENGGYGQARGIWNGDLFRGEIETNTSGNAQLRLRTGTVVTRDAFFAGRPTAEAFVLVDTGGIADVEVGGPSDRYVRTNKKGYALFPGLSANASQKLAVNVDKLPMDIGIVNEQQYVTPPPMSIVKASFHLVRINPVLVYLQDATGKQIPRGAVALIAGQEKHVIGSNGALYLESSDDITSIEVQMNKGTCLFNPKMPLSNDQILRASQCQ